MYTTVTIFACIVIIIKLIMRRTLLLAVSRSKSLRNDWVRKSIKQKQKQKGVSKESSNEEVEGRRLNNFYKHYERVASKKQPAKEKEVLVA